MKTTGQMLFSKEVNEVEKNILMNFGVLFSYINDLNDCFGESKKTGKNEDDIGSGKICLPIVCQLEIHDNDEIYRENYGLDILNIEAIKYFYDKFDVNKYCRKKISEHVNQLEKEILSTEEETKQIFKYIKFLLNSQM